MVGSVSFCKFLIYLTILFYSIIRVMSSGFYSIFRTFLLLLSMV
nr:MAG TPA: hypothetical protein [Caudoviricetes sp.]